MNTSVLVAVSTDKIETSQLLWEDMCRADADFVIDLPGTYPFQIT